MVDNIYSPKDFFIYGNGEKLWVVMNESIIEIKNYEIDSFMFSIINNTQPLYLLGGITENIYTNREMEFELHALVSDANFMEKKNVDASDFYTLEECKKLSKIIQRKFDKLLELNNHN